MFEPHIYEWSERLILREGMNLMPYYDKEGQLCIGVHRQLFCNPLNAAEQRALGDFMHGITINGAKMLLRNDVNRCLQQLVRSVKNFSGLSPDRQYVLLEMCFVLGWKELHRWKKMLTAIEHEHFDAAARECLQSFYIQSAPLRVQYIAKTIQTGKWQMKF